uniref:Uncharacterized protein n=1 Tax=viral metagenome TaxID=1070528 RepID=A0A2V0RMH2_9ZZZZ
MADANEVGNNVEAVREIIDADSPQKYYSADYSIGEYDLEHPEGRIYFFANSWTNYSFEKPPKDNRRHVPVLWTKIRDVEDEPTQRWWRTQGKHDITRVPLENFADGPTYSALSNAFDSWFRRSVMGLDQGLVPRKVHVWLQGNVRNDADRRHLEDMDHEFLTPHDQIAHLIDDFGYLHNFRAHE